MAAGERVLAANVVAMAIRGARYAIGVLTAGGSLGFDRGFPASAAADALRDGQADALIDGLITVAGFLLTEFARVENMPGERLCRRSATRSNPSRSKRICRPRRPATERTGCNGCRVPLLARANLCSLWTSSGGSGRSVMRLSPDAQDARSVFAKGAGPHSPGCGLRDGRCGKARPSSRPGQHKAPPSPVTSSTVPVVAFGWNVLARTPVVRVRLKAIVPQTSR